MSDPDLERTSQEPRRGESTGDADLSDEAQTTAVAPAEFRRSWGRLQIRDRLGAGGFGEVFRAFDPMLAVEVALKLRRADRATSDPFVGRFLVEARRLAQIRHPHVLQVHGADQHEGVAGLWTELLHGRTLEGCLAAQGPFGPQEAALIGLDLCKALAAVHAAGLVHRDVKTENVMREDGGRIVLMDFGAVTAITPSAREEDSISGTPYAMAPEIIRGEPASARSDLYSLGVLLYRLVSGRYPIEAATWHELLARHERGEATPLRDLRPNLPAGFVRVVERALAADPARRFASAGAMEQALAATIGTGGTAEAPARDPLQEPARSTEGEGAAIPPRPGAANAGLRSRGWPLALPAAGVLAALGLLRMGHGVEPPPVTGPETAHRAEPAAPPPPPAPSTGSEADGRAGDTPRRPDPGRPAAAPAPSTSAITSPLQRASSDSPEPLDAAPAGAAPMQIDAAIYRESRQADERLLSGAMVRPGDRLFLEIEGSEPIHVYVLNEDAKGSSFVLFPLPGLELRNPLAPHVMHRIPGPLAGQEQRWQVTTAGERERFLIVAAREPVPEIERALATIDRAEPGRPLVLDPRTVVRVRSIGGLVPTSTSPRTAGGALDQIAGSLPAAAATGDGVWVREIELANPAPGG